MMPATVRAIHCCSKGGQLSFAGWACVAAYQHFDWTMIFMLVCFMVSWLVDLEMTFPVGGRE